MRNGVLQVTCAGGIILCTVSEYGKFIGRMRSRNFSYIGHKLKVGFQLRCPNCEQGKLFAGRGIRRFNMVQTCPYCDVRFERFSGDAIGGVYINVAVTEFTSMTGFFLVNSLFHPPIMAQLFIWVPYALIFLVLFTPRAKGIWTAVMWLTGGVYADPDYTREYIAPKHVPYNRTPQEHED